MNQRIRAIADPAEQTRFRVRQANTSESPGRKCPTTTNDDPSVKQNLPFAEHYGFLSTESSNLRLISF
jgi:hypothetical protein